VSITTEVGPCPWDGSHRLVHVGLQGKHVAPGAVPPRNLVFLVDVSGSMSGELPLVVASLTYLTEQLGERDRIAIVVYAGAAGTVLPPTVGTDQDRILDALDRLEAGGSTNGGEGIERAYALAQEHFVEGGINRVVLATDGDFNVGTTGHEALVELIEAKRRSGVFLSVLGFGGANYQDHTMEQLADKGNGNYAYIDGRAEARKVLVEEVGGTLVTIAKDVKLQVDFDPRAVERYRLVGYTNRVLADRDFADDTKDAGEIGAGHTVTALYEIEPTAAPEPDADVMRLKLRYKQPDGERSRLVEVPVPDRGAALADTSDDFRFSAAVAGFGQALQGLPSATAPGSLVELRDLAANARGEDRKCRRAELVRLVEQASALRGHGLEPVHDACTPTDDPAPVVYAEPLQAEDAPASEDAPAGEPFDWQRFVLEVLYLLPPLLALPLFVMALRRPRRRAQ
jgi:Ca-activated chloride channel family protein